MEKLKPAVAVVDDPEQVEASQMVYATASTGPPNVGLQQTG
jgi:hypothetical protein